MRRHDAATAQFAKHYRGAVMGLWDRDWYVDAQMERLGIGGKPKASRFSARGAPKDAAPPSPAEAIRPADAQARRHADQRARLDDLRARRRQADHIDPAVRMAALVTFILMVCGIGVVLLRLVLPYLRAWLFG